MTSYSSSGYNAKRDVVDQIDAFIRDESQTTLKVKQGGGLSLVISGVFTVAGVLGILRDHKRISSRINAPETGAESEIAGSYKFTNP